MSRGRNVRAHTRSKTREQDHFDEMSIRARRLALELVLESSHDARIANWTAEAAGCRDQREHLLFVADTLANVLLIVDDVTSGIRPAFESQIRALLANETMEDA